MIDRMSDAQFCRRVAVVSHMLAMQKYKGGRPDTSRADAWEFAVNNWREFIAPALDFLAAQAVWREQRTVARARLN